MKSKNNNEKSIINLISYGMQEYYTFIGALLIIKQKKKDNNAPINSASCLINFSFVQLLWLHFQLQTHQ